SESYAREFARLNVPLLVARGGFYESIEISDLLSLLKVLDNPLQDLPVLAVLHSPLVGMSINELATIRLTCKGHFWTALVNWNEKQISKRKVQTSEKELASKDNPQPDLPFSAAADAPDPAATARKAGLFLERFS